MIKSEYYNTQASVMDCDTQKIREAKMKVAINLTLVDDRISDEEKVRLVKLLMNHWDTWDHRGVGYLVKHSSGYFPEPILIAEPEHAQPR